MNSTTTCPIGVLTFESSYRNGKDLSTTTAKVQDSYPLAPDGALARCEVQGTTEPYTCSFGCMLLAYGMYSLRLAEYDVFPEFASPQVSAQMEPTELSTGRVEILVTRSLENTVNRVPSVRNLR